MVVNAINSFAEWKNIIESGKPLVIAYADSLEISPALEAYSKKNPSIECYQVNLLKQKEIAKEQTPATVLYRNRKKLNDFMGPDHLLEDFLESALELQAQPESKSLE